MPCYHFSANKLLSENPKFTISILHASGLHSFTGPRTQVKRTTRQEDYRSRSKCARIDKLSFITLMSFCIAAEYYKGRLTNRFFPEGRLGGGGFTL